MKTSKLYPIKVNFSKKKECLVIGFILQNDNMDYIFYDNKIEACNLILNSFQKKELTKKMFFEVKDKFVSPCYVHVLKSYRKGSQGYFWVPSNEYHRY